MKKDLALWAIIGLGAYLIYKSLSTSAMQSIVSSAYQKPIP